jgi:hypothetical protein
MGKNDNRAKAQTAVEHTAPAHEMNNAQHNAAAEHDVEHTATAEAIEAEDEVETPEAIEVEEEVPTSKAEMTLAEIEEEESEIISAYLEVREKITGEEIALNKAIALVKSLEDENDADLNDVIDSRKASIISRRDKIEQYKKEYDEKAVASVFKAMRYRFEVARQAADNEIKSIDQALRQLNPELAWIPAKPGTAKAEKKVKDDAIEAATAPRGTVSKLVIDKYKEMSLATGFAETVLNVARALGKEGPACSHAILNYKRSAEGVQWHTDNNVSIESLQKEPKYK